MRLPSVKAFFWFALSVALMGLTAASLLLAMRDRAKVYESITHTGPTITELEGLGHLTVVRVHVADVIEGEQALWYGRVKGAWIVKGDALLTVDMRQAKILSKDSEAHTAVLSLPRPTVMQARVDHDITKTYRVDRGFFVSQQDESNLRDHAMRQAQMFVEQTADSEESVAQARETAEKLLGQFYKMVDWAVIIQWQDQTSTSRPNAPRE